MIRVSKKPIKASLKGLAFLSTALFSSCLLAKLANVSSDIALSGVSADGSRALGTQDGKAIYWNPTGGAVALPGGEGATALTAASNGTILGHDDSHLIYWISSGDTYTPTTITESSTIGGISHNGNYVISGRNIFQLSGNNYVLSYTGTAGVIGYAVDNAGVVGAGKNGTGAIFFIASIPASVGYGSAGDVIYGMSDGATYQDITYIAQRNSLAGKWAHPGTIPGGSGPLITLTFAGATSGAAYAITPDGTVIVGTSNGTPNGGTAGQHAFRWTQATGMQTVEQWLASTGASVRLSSSMETALGVSDDGNVIVGQLANGLSFFAVAGQSMIEETVLATSLSNLSNFSGKVLDTVDMMVHGAHGHPMQSLVPTGKSCGWVAGDLGRHTHEEKKGWASVMDVGLCQRVNESTQLSLSFGHNHHEIDLPFQSNQSMQGNYVMPEASIRLPRLSLPLWLTVGIPFQYATVKMQRGYSDGGMTLNGDIDISSGDTNMTTLGYRLRLDAVEIFRFVPMRTPSRTHFSPYLDFSYSTVKIDAYTETSGDFPAHWDAINDHSSIVRTGVDSVTRYGSFAVLGTIEYAHRMEKNTASAVASVDGVTFSIPGASVTTNWLHVGGGLEYRIGAHVISFLLNATTRSAQPTYWGAASYQVSF